MLKKSRMNWKLKISNATDYYYYDKICIAHKFKHAQVGGAGVARWENGLAGEGK